MTGRRLAAKRLAELHKKKKKKKKRRGESPLSEHHRNATKPSAGLYVLKRSNKIKGLSDVWPLSFKDRCGSQTGLVVSRGERFGKVFFPT